MNSFFLEGVFGHCLLPERILLSAGVGIVVPGEWTLYSNGSLSYTDNTYVHFESFKDVKRGMLKGSWSGFSMFIRQHRPYQGEGVEILFKTDPGQDSVQVGTLKPFDTWPEIRWIAMDPLSREQIIRYPYLLRDVLVEEITELNNMYWGDYKEMYWYEDDLSILNTPLAVFVYKLKQTE